MRRKTRLFLLYTLFILIGFSVNAMAGTVTYSGPVTPDVIFGSGNINGSFTLLKQGPNIDRDIELGLRAKLRFDENNLPQNTFNNNGDGTFSFDTGAATGGAGWVAPTTPIWNFEWSINANFNGTDGKYRFSLNDFDYLIGIDFDPSQGTDFLSFDPINLDYADHAFGNNTTPNGNGIVASESTQYAAFTDTYNVAQNSWNMEFFNDDTIYVFNPNLGGTYDFYLSAFLNETDILIGRTEMQVIVGEGGPPVPIPGAIWLLGSGFVAVVGIRRKSKR